MPLLVSFWYCLNVGLDFKPDLLMKSLSDVILVVMVIKMLFVVSCAHKDVTAL